MKTPINTALKAIVQKFDFLETFFVVGFATGMFLLISEIHIWTIVLWVSLGGLILLYWVMSFYKTDVKEETLHYFSRKVTWLSFAVASLGILLKVQFNEKAEFALLAGVVAIAAALIINIYLFFIKKHKKSLKSIIRSVVFALVTIILLML